MTQTLSKPVSSDDIRRGLDALGLSGASAEVHGSLSSFGRVQGGAEALARTLAGTLRTTLVPTFCWDATCTPLPGTGAPLRNGTGPDYPLGLLPRPRPFDPRTSPVDPGMGALPRAVLGLPGARRSSHPLNSWTAVGEEAAYFTSPYDPEDPYRPLKRLEESSGFILLLGVGLNSCTSIHLAEERSGRKIFVRWVLESRGQISRVRTGACSRGFEALRPALWGLGREIRIGSAKVWAAPMGTFVEAAARAIQANPRVTVCSSTCIRCQDAAAGGPLDQGVGVEVG